MDQVVLTARGVTTLVNILKSKDDHAVVLSGKNFIIIIIIIIGYLICGLNWSTGHSRGSTVIPCLQPIGDLECEGPDINWFMAAYLPAVFLPAFIQTCLRGILLKCVVLKIYNFK